MPALLLFLLLCWMPAAGSSLPSCNTTVSVRDLACHLDWKCSGINSSTTFTIETKTQGESWQNVSNCVQISSSVCDLSQVFTDFEVYKFIKLVLNHEHGEPQRMPSTLCDPIKDQHAVFSAPSVSLSLEDRVLRVVVSFPCAPSGACSGDYEEEGDDEEVSGCCPMSRFLKLNTTVILYNTHDAADTQTWTDTDPVLKGGVFEWQSGVLLPGQQYCAVARFWSSSLSEPQCVHVPARKSPGLFVLGLCGVLISAPVIVGGLLWRRWALTNTTLPKPLLSLVDQDVSAVEGPVIQALSEDEGSIVNLSIVSLPSPVLSDKYSAPLRSQSARDRYYTAAFLQDRDSEQEEGPEETRSYCGDLETDGGTVCVSYPWTRWSSLPALRTGMVCLLGVPVPVVDSGVPLNSVRVGGAQMELEGLNCDGALYQNICQVCN